jgi:hypothetical protein
MRYLLLLLFILPAFIANAQQTFENCFNGIDDDGDGLIDCADANCVFSSECSSESANFNCSDGIDNDGDGDIDCADSECNCTPVEICDNGVDDDGDCFAAQRQQDSLALVALYHATDGDNWTKNDNWLTGPLDTWYGIKLNKNRIAGLELVKNNLNGALPYGMNSLSALYYFNLSDNDINELPANLFESPLTSHGHMYRNRLTFEDVLIQDRYLPKLGDQQLVGKDTTVVLEKGESYTIYLHIDPEVTTNQYVWFRDQIAFDTTATNYYTLSNITGDDIGTYTCEVTNPKSIIDLTLRSHPTIIQVQDDRQSQTIVFDSIANHTYGDSSFVLRASTSANLPVRYQIIKGEGSVITLKDSTVTIVGTGQAAIAAQQDGNEEYLSATTVIRYFTVNKVPQKIRFAQLDSAWVGDTLTLVASSDASLPVSFSANGPYQVKNNRLVLTSAGYLTITAYQPGNDYYVAAPSVSQTIQVRQPLYSLSGQIWQQPNVPYVGKAYAVLYEADRNLGRNFRTQELPEDNTYHFDSLEAGKYTFMVSLYSAQYMPTYWGGHYLLSEAQKIQLQQDTTLNLTLLPTPVSPTRAWSSIRGRLVGPAEADNGRSAEANNALAEVSVYLRDAETGELLARAVTDETGAFAFTELLKGTYTLAIDYQGLPVQENTAVVGDYQEATVLATVTDKITVTVENKVVTALNNEISPYSVNAFPNPVTDNLVIQANGLEWIGATVRLQNILGNTVGEITIQHALTILDMSNQKAGIYLLTVKQGNVLETQKVVKW